MKGPDTADVLQTTREGRYAGLGPAQSPAAD